jgi:hypothetical protein
VWWLHGRGSGQEERATVAGFECTLTHDNVPLKYRRLCRRQLRRVVEHTEQQTQSLQSCSPVFLRHASSLRRLFEGNDTGLRTTTWFERTASPEHDVEVHYTRCYQAVGKHTVSVATVRRLQLLDGSGHDTDRSFFVALITSLST